MSKNYVVVEAMEGRLLMTKKDYNEARKGYGEAYEALCEKMREHPTFKVAYIEREKHIERKKRTYEGLNDSFMTDYVAAQGDKKLIKEFEEVKLYAENNKLKVYAFAKKWFLKKFSSKDKPFDMDDAKQVIYEYRMTIVHSKLTIVDSTKHAVNE